jgi:hypothetical protein
MWRQMKYESKTKTQIKNRIDDKSREWRANQLSKSQKYYNKGLQWEMTYICFQSAENKPIKETKDNKKFKTRNLQKFQNVKLHWKWSNEIEIIKWSISRFRRKMWIMSKWDNLRFTLIKTTKTSHRQTSPPRKSWWLSCWWH